MLTETAAVARPSVRRGCGKPNLPPGWNPVKEYGKLMYPYYRGPNGRTASSPAAAWRVQQQADLVRGAEALAGLQRGAEDETGDVSGPLLKRQRFDEASDDSFETETSDERTSVEGAEVDGEEADAESMEVQAELIVGGGCHSNVNLGLTQFEPPDGAATSASRPRRAAAASIDEWRKRDAAIVALIHERERSSFAQALDQESWSPEDKEDLRAEQERQLNEPDLEDGFLGERDPPYLAPGSTRKRLSSELSVEEPETGWEGSGGGGGGSGGGGEQREAEVSEAQAEVSEAEERAAGPHQAALVAVAEGLRLHLSSKSKTGYKGVCEHIRNSNKFAAKHYATDGATVNLGSFDTAVEAAVAYARAVGEAPEPDAASAAGAEAEAAEPEAGEEEAEAAAEAEAEAQRFCFVARADGFRQALTAAAELVIGRTGLGINDRCVSREQIRLKVNAGDEGIVVVNVGRHNIGLQRTSGTVAPIIKGNRARVSASHLPATIFLAQVHLSVPPLPNFSLMPCPSDTRRARRRSGATR